MSKFLEMMGSLTEEQTSKLGKFSTRLNEAGVHAVTIKDAYETEGEYPQLVVEFSTAGGQDITWRGFLMSTDFNTKEKVQDLKVFGFFLNIHKVIFGTEFSVKNIGKGITQSTITKADKSTATVTSYGQLKGKKLGIATYTEVTAEDKKNKNDAKVHKNQVVEIKHVFNSSLVEVSELAKGLTEGVMADAIDKTMKSTFKYGSGYKDHKFVKVELEILTKGGVSSTSSNAAPVASDDEDPFA